MELLLTGERIDAARAKEIGLAGWVVPHDELDGRGPRAWRRGSCGRRRSRRGRRRRWRCGPQHLSMLEAIRFGETMRKVAGATDDAAEGIRAAAEGRPPVW